MKAKGYHECLVLISDAILKIKTENTNPYLVIAGDFNKKDVTKAIGDYQDLQIIETDPTRGDAHLNLAAVSFIHELESTGNHAPLTDRKQAL